VVVVVVAATGARWLSRARSLSKYQSFSLAQSLTCDDRVRAIERTIGRLINAVRSLVRLLVLSITRATFVAAWARRRSLARSLVRTWVKRAANANATSDVCRRSGRTDGKESATSKQQASSPSVAAEEGEERRAARVWLRWRRLRRQSKMMRRREKRAQQPSLQAPRVCMRVYVRGARWRRERERESAAGVVVCSCCWRGGQQQIANSARGEARLSKGKTGLGPAAYTTLGVFSLRANLSCHSIPFLAERPPRQIPPHQTKPNHTKPNSSHTHLPLSTDGDQLFRAPRRRADTGLRCIRYAWICARLFGLVVVRAAEYRCYARAACRSACYASTSWSGTRCGLQTDLYWRRAAGWRHRLLVQDVLQAAVAQVRRASPLCANRRRLYGRNDI